VRGARGLVRELHMAVERGMKCRGPSTACAEPLRGPAYFAQDDNLEECGPMKLGRWTAEGGCPHMDFSRRTQKGHGVASA
jgi:hypothetical protein